ncbi:MAG: T9SS type A sorting domain-containing protein [Bacteroidota bacterium]
MRKYSIIIILLILNTNSLFAQQDWNWGNYGDSTFIPITVWLQDTYYIEQYQDAGFNVYQGFWAGIKENQISDLRAKKMHYICGWNKTGREDEPDLLARANIDDSLFIAWIHRDEPDNAQSDGQGGYGACIDPQVIIDGYNEIKAFDTTGRQVVLNCGAGVARTDAYIRGDECAGNTDMYTDYYMGADIASFDIYPVASPPAPMTTNDELWYVPQGVKNMKRWTNNSNDDYWFCLECTDIKGDGKPTPEQIWIEAWMGIVAGGKGLLWFPFTVYPNVHNSLALLQDSEMLAAVTKVNRAVHDAAVVINSEPIDNVVDMELSQSPIFDTPVEYIVKHVDDTLYIFSSGMRDYGPNTATFTINTINGSDITSNAIVMYEDREIEILNNQFSQDYDGQSIHLFKIGGISLDMIVGVKESSPQIVSDFSLEQNYPNPFNPSTTIKYSLPIVETRHASSLRNVTLKIFDLLGREMATLVNEQQKPGNYEIIFDASHLSSGMYFYKLNTPHYSKIMKMLLLK